MSVITNLCRSFVSRGQNPTEEAKNFGNILDSDGNSDSFLQSTVDELHKLEYKTRRGQISKVDINFISECIITDINERSKRKDLALQRVDGYFYSFGKLKKLCQAHKTPPESFEKLSEAFLSFLVSIFDQTKGHQPNLLTKNKDLLTYINMNMEQFLQCVATINSAEDLKRFLVICKFVLQIDSQRNGADPTRQWIKIMSNVKHINISLIEFVDTYLIYRDGFQEFIFGISMLIHLIQRIHSHQTKESSILSFCLLSRKLLIKMSVFLTHFKPVFSENVRNGSHTFERIAQFLKWLIFKSRIDSSIVLGYISEYANNATKVDFWNMFLVLYGTGGMNETVRQHLNIYAHKQILSVSIQTFRQCAELAKESLQKISEQFKEQLMEVFENIFDDYTKQMIQPSHQRHQVTRTEYRDLLEIGLKLLNSTQLKRDSIFLLVHRAVFTVDSIIRNGIQKLVDMFKNLNMIDATLCSEYPVGKIFQDDWLSNFLITHINIWLKIDRDIYESLTSNSQRHPWTNYIWSRICYLSIPKMFTNNKIEALSKISRWMETVQHHIYSPTDNLTIILMVNLFELILERLGRYALLVPHISNIFNYIIAMKQHSMVKPCHNRIEIFLKSVIGYVEELLRLNGKFISNQKRDDNEDGEIRRI